MKIVERLTSGVVLLVSALCAGMVFGDGQVAKFVEYVQTDGNQNTGAWVLLDYTPCSNSVVEADIEFLNDSQTMGVFCARGNDTAADTFTLFRIGTSGLRWDYNRTTALYEKAAVNVRHTIRCANTGLTLDGESSGTATAMPLNYQPANKMMLFASYTCKPTATPTATGNRGSVKLYGFRVWDEDGAKLAVDLYPCVDTNGKCGLYDNMSGRIYYSSQSDKPLVASATEVPPPPQDDALYIESTTAAFGAVSPAYGVVTGLSDGDVRTCTAPESVAISPYSTAICTGWTLYTYDKTNGLWYESASGASATCEYTHARTTAKLVWQWSVTVTPDAEKTTLYVSPTGDDANDGSTPEKAFRTIPAAIGAASAETRTVILALPGTYVAENTEKQANDAVYCVYINKPVELVAVEGPSRTTVNATTTAARAGAFLAHADAVLAGFSFENCLHGAKNKPDGLEANAGAISNCVVNIRGQWARQGCYVRLWGTAKGYDLVLAPKSQGGSESSSFVYLYENSVLDGLTISKMKYTGTGLGYLVEMTGNAILRNALIADNEQGSYEVASLKPLVYLNSATCRLEDSTIVNNLIYSQDGAVQVANSKAVVTNTIVYFNSSKNAVNKNIHNGSNKARFFVCCSDELTEGENGNITVDPQFVDAANGNYHLRSLSKAKEMGVVALRPTGATTLECAGDADTYASPSGEPLTATFSGYCAGAQGDLAAVWNFGDGETSTDWPTATHAYETPGAYTVTLTLNDGVSDPAVYVFSKQLVCTPTTCYMSTTGSNTYPYDTWAKATPSLQAALDVGSYAIVVTNGTYEIPAPVIGISRAVTLTSVEGPEKTTFTSLGATSCNHRNLNVAGSDDIVISGFTFTDGYASGYEWTASIDMSAGTLTNCVFKDIRRVSRSAACYFSGTAKVVDCVFDGHGMTWSNDSATQSGVRIEGSAVLDRCEIFAFKIENNSESGYDGESPVRIAAANAVLRNSYVHHCTNGVPTKPNVKNRGPIGLVNGRIENCTIVNNVCAGYGGGVWAIGGTVVNSIIWDNEAGMAGKDVYVRGSATPSFLYSCASDFTDGAAITGEGCTAKSPNFDGEKPYHLTPLSTACLNTGTMLDWMTAGALDKDQLPRIVRNGEIAADGVDMGCYEYQESTVVPLDGTIDVVGGASGRAPFTATLEASIVGDEQGLALVWDFGDGEPVAGGKRVTHTFENPGSYLVTVRAANGAGETADIAATVPVVVVPQVCYVSTEGKGIAPYMTWEDAATNIADAVELNPKTVFVSNGLYKIETDINIHSDLELRSVNGPEVTIIDAQGKCRNLWMTDQAEGAVVDGFTFRRGIGDWGTKSSYARVEAGVLSHCIMSNAVSSYRDSAVMVKGKGRMTDCVVDTFGMGGNADSEHYWGTVVQSGGVIERCTIQRYNYTNQGGAGNTHGAVHVEGTGIFRNCLVKDCVTTQSANAGTYRAAVLVKDTGVVENCTIVNSKSCQPGAGLTILSGTPTVRNCIVWGAKLGDGTATTAVRDLGSPATPRLTYSCAPELTTGEGNTTGDPKLGRRRNAYMPGSGSSCINAGLTLDWMDENAVDLGGNPRKTNGNPDMGCYETPLRGTGLLLR